MLNPLPEACWMHFFSCLPMGPEVSTGLHITCEAGAEGEGRNDQVGMRGVSASQQMMVASHRQSSGWVQLRDFWLL